MNHTFVELEHISNSYLEFNSTMSEINEINILNILKQSWTGEQKKPCTVQSRIHQNTTEDFIIKIICNNSVILVAHFLILHVFQLTVL